MLETAYSMGKQALALVNAEHKRIDVTDSGTLSTGSGTLGPVLLSGASQGDTAQTRDGNKIRLKGLDFIMRVNASNSAVKDTFGRLIIFKVHQPQGSLPSTTDIVETANDPETLTAWDTRGTFKILHDQFLHCRAVAKKTAFTRVDLKLDMHQIFSGSGSTVTAIETGAICFLYLYNTDVSNASEYEYQSRIVFMDN
jgi:hypothetical protein